MVIAASPDGNQFHTAIDGGSIRKYPINVDDLMQITDDVSTLKQSPIMCVDSTCATGVPDTVIIGCAKGNLHLCFPNWGVEKSVLAPTGGVTCVSVNRNWRPTASGGKDVVVKILSRNGILRTNLASFGGAVTLCNWDNTGKYPMFMCGGTVTVRSESFKQDQAQFRVCRRLVTCRAWNRASGELITRGEDRITRVFDADGWMLAESAAGDFAVSSVAFLPPVKLCLIGMVNRLFLTDNRLLLFNTITVAAGAAICVSPERPRVIVAGTGTASLIAVVGKKLVFGDSQIFAGSPRKLIIFDPKNGVSATLQFAESIIIFHLNFNRRVKPKCKPSKSLSKDSAD
jgi:hypothetical protein